MKIFKTLYERFSIFFRIKNNPFYYFSFLRFFLSFITKPRSVSDLDFFKKQVNDLLNKNEDISINTNQDNSKDKTKKKDNKSKKKSILYIMQNRSFCDYLVLYSFCVKNGLPLPREENVFYSKGPYFTYFKKLGLFQTKTIKKSVDTFPNIFLHVANSSSDLICIPVSILWGRKPVNEERYPLFKLLFPDDQDAGIIHKFFIVLAQGRDIWLSFSDPFSIKEKIVESDTKDLTKITDTLKEDLSSLFTQIRASILGPSIYERRDVIDSLFQQQKIQDAIDTEVQKTHEPRRRVERRAYRYLEEISASQSYSVVKAFGIVLSLILHKLFNSIIFKNVSIIQNVYKDYEIVYLPAHRSYFDFLAFPTLLHTNGFNVPHIAAGKNLNFWLVGSIFRKCGAFFIRRTFKGDRLYKVTFDEYLKFLLYKGHSIMFFPEGTRSRSGKSLKPKTGLLSIIVHNYLVTQTKPIVFVPLYIGYDFIIEINSYIKEFTTNKKEQESFLALLKAAKVLKKKYGNVYINCAKPIFLNEYLDSKVPNWKETSYDIDQKPEWFSSVINQLAFDIMSNLTSSIYVSPSSIVSYTLLSVPQKSLPEQELLSFMDTVINLLKHSSFTTILLPDQTSKEILVNTEKVLPLKRFSHQNGDVIHVDEKDSLSLYYYTNNILPLLSLYSLIASFFLNNDRVVKKILIEKVSFVYQFLCSDFFIKYDANDIEKAISTLIELNLLVEKDSSLYRINSASSLFIQLQFLGRSISPYIARHSIFFITVNSFKNKITTKKEILDLTSKTVKRLFLLNGIISNISEKEETLIYSSLMDLLLDKNILEIKDDVPYITNDTKILIKDGIEEIFLCYESIVSKDISYNISRQNS